MVKTCDQIQGCEHGDDDKDEEYNESSDHRFLSQLHFIMKNKVKKVGEKTGLVSHLFINQGKEREGRSLDTQRDNTSGLENRKNAHKFLNTTQWTPRAVFR